MHRGSIKSKQMHENSFLFQLGGKELEVWYNVEISGKCVIDNRKLDTLVRVVEVCPNLEGRKERLFSHSLVI